MEGGEVEGDVGAKMGEDPFGELAGFGGSSLRVGMMRLVISNQTRVSFLSQVSMSRTGWRWVRVILP